MEAARRPDDPSLRPPGFWAGYITRPRVFHGQGDASGPCSFSLGVREPLARLPQPLKRLVGAFGEDVGQQLDLASADVDRLRAVASFKILSDRVSQVAEHAVVTSLCADAVA